MSHKILCSTCNKVIDRGTECECKKKRKAEIDKQYNIYSRDKESKAIYESRQWRLMVEVVRTRDNGLCQLCLKNKRATLISLVHHIKPISEGGQPYSLDNLISLCTLCHSHTHSVYDKSEEDKKVMQELLIKIVGSE